MSGGTLEPVLADPARSARGSVDARSPQKAIVTDSEPPSAMVTSAVFLPRDSCSAVTV